MLNGEASKSELCGTSEINFKKLLNLFLIWTDCFLNFMNKLVKVLFFKSLWAQTRLLGYDVVYIQKLERHQLKHVSTILIC